ncbi:uncharacterized protein [Montipora capricornis]|uniref:uncharacterized protein n=1 Tax=Montipora capricornis TaxID=246305 RepID=UPI0035F140D1
MDAPLSFADFYSMITFVTNDIIPAGLRTIFKQEWDNRYKDTLGEWKDQPKNGQDFLRQESKLRLHVLPCVSRNAQFLATVVNGDSNQWDAPTLLYSILHSKCIGDNLNPEVKKSIDKLRSIRIKVLVGLSAVTGHKMSYSELYAPVSGVLDAFTALGLSTQQIQEITNQTKSLISELKEGVDPNKEDTKTLGLFTQEISLSTDLHAFVINELEKGHHPHNEEMKIVLDAITALGRSTQQIQDITSQTESPISELKEGDDPNKEDRKIQGRVAVENEYALGIVAHEHRADTDFQQTAMENTEDNEHKECAKPVIGLAKGSFAIDSMFSFHWKQIQDTLGQLERARYEDDIDKMKPLMELLKHWKDAGDRIMGKRNELDSMVKSCAEEGSDGVTHGYRPDTDSPPKGEEVEIVEASMKFEAEHEECVRVLPYKENDQVVIRFYVFSGESGALESLKVAAQEFFAKMKVELRWLDLYNNAVNILNVTPLGYVCGESHELALEAYQVDAINEVINENLSKFDKHRNVTSVQASFKVTNSQQTREPCIRIYVLGKGFIPMGESKFEPFLGPYPVDVVDGFWYRTRDIWTPNQAQKQNDVVCLGASIGVKGEGGCGTLGAIVEDGVGGLYALSCDHVIKHGPIVQNEIVHPGLDDHLNYLRYHLCEYAHWIDEITGPGNEETEISGAENLQKPEMREKFNRLRELKEANLNSERCLQWILKKAEEHEEAFKAGLKEPRVVGSYTKGLRCNFKWTNDKEYFVDAAIAKLTDDEVIRLKESKIVQVIGRGVRPNGECCPVKDIMNAELLCKSGRTTGYTENGHVVDASVDAPGFLAPPMFEAQSDATFNIRLPHTACPESDTRQTSQSQMEPIHGMTCKKMFSNVVCERVWRKSCLFIDAKRHFVHEGDSGAVIFEKRRESRGLRGFGIIFAMHENSYKIYAIASPLEVVLDALSSEISEGNLHTLRLVSELNS